MVNGTVSRILYIGALALIGIILIGKLALAFTDHETTSDVTNVMYTLLAFLFGTHVMLAVGRKQMQTIAEQVAGDE